MAGHGHVIPNADGSLARCGGPGLCDECSREEAQVKRNEREDHLAAGEVSVEEAKDILSRFVASHFRSKPFDERARFTIPADPRRDSDIRMSAFIRRAELAFAEVDRLRRIIESLSPDGTADSREPPLEGRST